MRNFQLSELCMPNAFDRCIGAGGHAPDFQFGGGGRQAGGLEANVNVVLLVWAGTNNDADIKLSARCGRHLQG
jgi:hypothetical protein